MKRPRCNRRLVAAILAIAAPLVTAPAAAVPPAAKPAAGPSAPVAKPAAGPDAPIAKPVAGPNAPVAKPAAGPNAPVAGLPPLPPPAPLGPLPRGTTATSTHGPFVTGECGLCHGPAPAGKRVGPLVRPARELCLECHEEFGEILKRRVKHRAVEDCLGCHNPHEARAPHLLREDLASSCLRCHERERALVLRAPVRHGALDGERKCLACHNPHASNVDALLVRLPYDLCVTCHGSDMVKDHRGLRLTNIRRLLDESKVRHGPVEAKDCSACHTPHGGDHARLLVAAYPAEFYAPFSARSYALCLDCHEEAALTTPETTALTRFRDGKRNLHYVHVSKEERGRTCRACHEVHAARQPHHIRDAVPYGSKRWMLPINYTPSPSGGSCEKTCHSRKEYDNGGGRGVAATKPAAPKAK